MMIHGDPQRTRHSDTIYRDGGFAYRLEPYWAQWPRHLKGVTAVCSCCDGSGNLYVSTRGVPESPIVVFAPDGSYVRSIGAGLFSDNLHGLFVTPRQTLLCTDGDRHAVREISLEDGRLIRDFGRLDEPSDTGYETDMYTWLKREGKIPAHFAPFSSTIAFIDRFDTIKRAGAPFNKPTRMIEAPNGDFFATDGYGNAAVHHFAPDGSLIKTWGGPGRGEGQFRLPHGLWLDSRSRLWVADRENNRVQVFTTGGELLAVIDGLYRPAEIWADGAHVYVGEVDGGVTIFDMDMQICAQLGFFYSSLIAHGLCGDGQGNLYIQTLWFQKSSNVMRLKRL